MIEKNNNLDAILNNLKIEAFTGAFYWRARDIQYLLNNCTWKKLNKSIHKIKSDCLTQGLDISNDIIPTNTTINDGIDPNIVDDFYLSRLVVLSLLNEYNSQNSNPAAFGKSTFYEELNKKKISFKVYILVPILAMFTVFLILVLSIFYLPIKPFRELRDLYIATAMTTYTHQWLATSFFSEETINEVMGEVPEDFNENSKEIKFHVTGNNIEIFDISGPKYEGKLLKISNPSKVEIALSSSYGKMGEFLEGIISDNGAVAGINASGFVDYNGHGKGAYPIGILIKDGKIIYDPGNSSYDVVGFDYEDNLIVGTYTKDELKKLNLRDAADPFYKLIINGNERIKGGNGGYGLHPRTAIGQTKSGTVLMLVIDGRQLHSIGATMKDCQDILMSYGAINAAALDGGSSSVMYYDGKVQTKPSNGTTTGRYLPSAFVVYD